MLAVLLAAATFVSTLIGGLTALRHKDNLHRFLGYTAGVLLGVVAFDLLPEIFDQLKQINHTATGAMIALVRKLTMMCTTTRMSVSLAH
jgi:zinc and cadmium transporter